METVLYIIQGDTTKIELYNLEIDHSGIDKMIFSCHELGIQKECQYNEESNSYVLEFAPEETKHLDPGKTDYDITLFLTNGTVYTRVYRGGVFVLPKTNSVSVEETEEAL